MLQSQREIRWIDREIPKVNVLNTLFLLNLIIGTNVAD